MKPIQRTLPRLLLNLSRLRIPIELMIGLGFGIFFLIGTALGMPVSLPKLEQMSGLGMHFFIPTLFAALIQFVFTLIYALLHRRHVVANNGDPFILIKLLPLLLFSVFFYFNVKYWAHLINPHLYDAHLEQIDQMAAPLLAGMRSVRQFIASQVGEIVDSLYIILFVVMFFMSLAMHGVLDSTLNQRRLMLGLCLNLLLGGLSYEIMPALGPFIYHPGMNVPISVTQQSMYEAHQQFMATGVVPEGGFTAALGAMPSLHIGHSFFFILWAAYRIRPLLVFYLPIFAWIVIEASASGYHYLADMPAGALLAVCSFILANKLVREPRATHGTDDAT